MCRHPTRYHMVPSGAHNQAEDGSEHDQGGSLWRAPGASEPLHALERRRSTDESRPYGIPLLTRAFEWPSPERDAPPPRFPPRFSPSIEPPLTPSTEAPRGPASVRSHLESESRLASDLQCGRHRSAPLYGSDDWDRRMSFGRLPLPGAQPEANASRVVLPPVSHLLGELGMLLPERYERGPVLPQLRLPEERDMGSARREEGERTKERKGRVELGEEGEEKRPVARKIYVACDFCRGRKLRCDGGRPRCSNCDTRSLECKYQEHPRRRGPGKAPKGTRARKPRKRGGGEDPDMAGPSVFP